MAGEIEYYGARNPDIGVVMIARRKTGDGRSSHRRGGGLGITVRTRDDKNRVGKRGGGKKSCCKVCTTRP
ncbi:hypothetical protein VTO73DRAFT_5292 [Trametes versicolor]